MEAVAYFQSIQRSKLEKGVLLFKRNFLHLFVGMAIRWEFFKLKHFNELDTQGHVSAGMFLCNHLYELDPERPTLSNVLARKSTGAS